MEGWTHIARFVHVAHLFNKVAFVRTMTSSTNISGFTPLILAASGGHTEVCKLLLEAGCIVDACADRTKDTALSMACSGGRKEVKLFDYSL